MQPVVMCSTRNMHRRGVQSNKELCIFIHKLTSLLVASLIKLIIVFKHRNEIIIFRFIIPSRIGVSNRSLAKSYNYPCRLVCGPRFYESQEVVYQTAYSTV